MKNLADDVQSFLRKQGPLVLCVDDEPQVLDALRRCLRNEPYSVITASDAGEALALLGQVSVDLVIVDQRMPGLTGTEFLREARARSPRTARAILTGYETPSTVRKGLEAGAETFLYKPWSDEGLRATIRRILKRSRGAGSDGGGGHESSEEGSFDLGGAGR